MEKNMKKEILFGGIKMRYELVPIEKLRPLEYVFPQHLKNLTEMIYKDKVMKHPLIVEKEHGIVLDGSHRYVFLLHDSFKLAPVIYVDYNSPHIRVGTHLMHRHIVNGPVNISKKEVVRRGLGGDLFPPRTTRHFFPFRKYDSIDVPLSKLEKGEKKDVKKYVADVSIQDEIKHNKKYLSEIDEEIDEIIKYLEEVRLVEKYLNKQVEEMENETKA